MKRIFALLLVVCLAMGLPTFASAESQEPVTVEQIAENWIATQYTGEAKVSRITSLLSYQNERVGEMVAFERDGVPCGYIVLSVADGEYPIVEFSMEGDNAYDYLVNSFEVAKNSSLSASLGEASSMLTAEDQVEEDVMYTDFIRYSIRVNRGNESLLFDQYGKMESFAPAHEISSSSDLEWGDSVVFSEGYAEFLRDGDGWEDDLLPGARSNMGLVANNMPDGSKGNNCVPTAMTMLIKMYAEKPLNGHAALTNLKYYGSDPATYTRLATLMNYVAGSGIDHKKGISALQTYVAQKNYTCSVDDYLWDFWSDFTRDIDNKKPIILHTRSNAGHSQIVVGYRNYTNGAKYLRVFSGWRNYSTFVKYKASVFTEFWGYCVAVS